MSGPVGLPLRPRRLERVAGAPRNPGLLALLATRLGHLLRRQALRPRGRRVLTLDRLRVLDLHVDPFGRRFGCRQPCRWRVPAKVAATAIAAVARGAAGARSPTAGLAAAAAPDRHRLQRRPARARHGHAASRRAVLCTAPSAPLTVSVSFVITSLWICAY